MTSRLIPQRGILRNQFPPRNEFHIIPEILLSFNKLEFFENQRVLLISGIRETDS